MRLFRSVATTAIAAALCVSASVTPAAAQVRANAAVPVSAYVAPTPSSASIRKAWPAFVMMGALLAIGIVITAEDDNDRPISRG